MKKIKDVGTLIVIAAGLVGLYGVSQVLAHYVMQFIYVIGGKF